MAHIVVRIAFNSKSKEQLEKDLKQNAEEWFPTKNPAMISIDAAYLRVDPKDDSYYLFEFVEVLD